VPTSIEGVEKTNTGIVRNSLQGQGSGRGKMRRNPYAIEIVKSRNCYSCG